MRVIILLQCTECKNRNYSTRKNKKNTTGKLSLRKYCNSRQCRKHSVHKEVKP
jgi:large subunit ribosomal protein L33